jgi:hypothetical protein
MAILGVLEDENTVLLVLKKRVCVDWNCSACSTNVTVRGRRSEMKGEEVDAVVIYQSWMILHTRLIFSGLWESSQPA